MTISKRIRLLIVALGLSLVGLPILSQAAGENWYIGGSVSQAYVDETGIDDDDTGFNIFGGYRFNEYFAIEAAYYDFGDMSDNGNKFSIDGGSLGVIGSIPVAKRFSLFGKVGIHAWDADVSGAIAGEFSDTTDTDVFYGVGAEYQLSGPWSIRGDFTRYEVDDFDVDVASLGLSYHF